MLDERTAAPDPTARLARLADRIELLDLLASRRDRTDPVYDR